MALHSHWPSRCLQRLGPEQILLLRPLFYSKIDIPPQKKIAITFPPTLCHSIVPAPWSDNAGPYKYTISYEIRIKLVQ
jgi:hypothetical protein